MKKTEDGKYILQVGDETVEVSEEELYSRASKGFGAEKKFEEASRIRSEAETALDKATQQLRTEFAQLLQTADQGSVEAYEKVLDMMGVRGPEKFERIRQFQEDSEGEVVTENDNQKAASSGNVQPPPQLKSAMDLATALEAQGMTVDDVIKTLQDAKKAHRQGIRERIFTDLKATLDKDPKVGKIVSAGGPKAERLVEIAKEKVRGRIFDGVQPGPDLYAKVLTEVKGIVDDFGTGEEPTSPPGLGHSPFVSQLVSQAKEPPKPEPVTSQGYAENVAMRLAQMVAAPDDEE